MPRPAQVVRQRLEHRAQRLGTGGHGSPAHGLEVGVSGVHGLVHLFGHSPAGRSDPPGEAVGGLLFSIGGKLVLVRARVTRETTRQELPSTRGTTRLRVCLRSGGSGGAGSGTSARETIGEPTYGASRPYT